MSKPDLQDFPRAVVNAETYEEAVRTAKLVEMDNRLRQWYPDVTTDELSDASLLYVEKERDGYADDKEWVKAWFAAAEADTKLGELELEYSPEKMNTLSPDERIEVLRQWLQYYDEAEEFRELKLFSQDVHQPS